MDDVICGCADKGTGALCDAALDVVASLLGDGFAGGVCVRQHCSKYPAGLGGHVSGEMVRAPAAAWACNIPSTNLRARVVLCLSSPFALIPRLQGAFARILVRNLA